MNNEVYLEYDEVDLVYDGVCLSLRVYVTPGCGWNVVWGGDCAEHYTGTGDWQYISHGDSPIRCVHILAEDGGEIIGIGVGGDECSWSKIDVSRCPSLRYFMNNRAEALDVSCNPLLKELDCQNGTFGALDLSANPELEKLTCNWCKDLTALNLSQNLALRELDICFSGIKRLGLHNRSVLQQVVMEDVELDERSEKYLLQILERNGGEVRKKMYDF